ncbi:MAG: hypothetical protein NVV73_07040 [Cellvibrionaceae bacterium]|nr:hypothetical protein [Cellvibrionaceae bacterium]
MEIIFSKNQKASVSRLTQVTELIESARLHGAVFRRHVTGEVFLRGAKRLPPALMEKLRENQKEVRERVINSFASFVWSVEVDGRRVRVIDPQRKAQAEFVDSMWKQFGRSRVGSCVRLWPPENRDE